MLRYCTNCEEDFDFDPRAVSGGGELICPKCGNVIDKNSRHPVEDTDEQIEENIGSAFEKLWSLAYIFYVTLAIIGIIGFFISDKVLLITTVIAVAAYILQLITGTTAFTLGILFIPVGAVLGYFAIGEITGACLGICIVFLVRHLIRDIILGLLVKLIQHGN